MGDINPYVERKPTQTTTDQQTLIRDCHNGNATSAGRMLERSLIDADGANRTIDVQQTYLRTQDGRLIRDVATEAIYACRTCDREDLHEHAMRSCDRCATIICRFCVIGIETEGEDIEFIEFCPRCYQDWRREWLFSLSA